MPLIKSGSPRALKENVREMIHSGRPKDQALAAAYRVKRQARAIGGVARPPWNVRAEASALAHTGPVLSAVGGRSDHHFLDVPAHSHVIPADVVGAMGSGNTLAGMKLLGSYFKAGPYGSAMPGMARPKMSAPLPKMPKLRASGGTDGGTPGTPVPVALSGGEFVIAPEDVQRVGKGDMNAGHEILDKWIVNERANDLAKRKKLPPPAKR